MESAPPTKEPASSIVETQQDATSTDSTSGTKRRRSSSASSGVAASIFTETPTFGPNSPAVEAMLQHFAGMHTGCPDDFKAWLISMELEEYQFAGAKLTQDRELWGFVGDKIYYEYDPKSKLLYHRPQDDFFRSELKRYLHDTIVEKWVEAILKNEESLEFKNGIHDESSGVALDSPVEDSNTSSTDADHGTVGGKMKQEVKTNDPDESSRSNAHRESLIEEKRMQAYSKSVELEYKIRQIRYVVDKYPDVILHKPFPGSKYRFTGLVQVVIEIARPSDFKNLFSLAHDYVNYCRSCEVFIGIDLRYPESKEGTVYIWDFTGHKDGKPFHAIRNFQAPDGTAADPFDLEFPLSWFDPPARKTSTEEAPKVKTEGSFKITSAELADIYNRHIEKTIHYESRRCAARDLMIAESRAEQGLETPPDFEHEEEMSDRQKAFQAKQNAIRKIRDDFFSSEVAKRLENEGPKEYCNCNFSEEEG